MSKKITRTIAIFILAASFFALVSCAGTNGTNDDSFNLDFNGNDTDEITFDGMEFILRDHDHGGTYDIIPVYGENRLDDMLLERYKQMENDYNCKITLLEGDSDGLIVNFASGLDKYADIMYDKINRAYGAIQMGAYLDIYSIDGIDLSSGQFGSQTLLDSMTWNGELYIMYPPTWANHFAHTMLYNPRLISTIGQTDPHEYYEQGQWTWDTFEKMAADFSSPAGTNYSYRTTIMALSNVVTDAALYSNGVTWTKVGPDGHRVIAYDCPETYETLEWLRKMYAAGYLADDYNWEPNAIAFINGETLFYANYSWMGISKDGGYIPTNMDEEFRWISFPQGPSGSEPTGVLTFTNPFFLVTVETDTAVIGDFCTLLFAQLGEDENDWWDSFNRENFFEEDSFNYYKRMLESLTFDYSVFINKTSVIDSPFMQVIKGNKSTAEVLDSVRDITQNNLDSYFN